MKFLIQTLFYRLPISVLFWLIVFFIILSPRLTLIRDYGFAHPYWDQWDSEGIRLIKPYLENNLKLTYLLAPNSEHRIVLTRVLQIILLIIGNQWDCLTQAVTNAFLFSLMATGFLIMLSRTGNKNSSLFPVIFFIIIFVLPIGWANTLWGFQSQFYFLIFFSLYAIILTCKSVPFSKWWWVCYGVAFASFLGMAGGMLTAAVCGLLQFLRFCCDQYQRKLHGIAILAWSTQFFSLFFWTPFVPGNILKATTLSDFCVSLFRNLAFPFPNPTLCIPLLLISLACFITALNKRTSMNWTQLDRSLLGCLMWATGQATAIAYNRGAGGSEPAQRYYDVLILLVPAVVTLLWRLPYLSNKKGSKLICLILSMSLLALYALGMMRVIRDNLRYDLPKHNDTFQRQEENLRKIIRKNDFEAFGTKNISDTGSYLSVERMRELLSAPVIREVLAPSIRTPLHKLTEESYFSAEPFDLSSLGKHLDNLQHNRLAIVSFYLEHEPPLWLQWRALQIRALLITGPTMSQSTQYSLIFECPISDSAQVVNLLLDLKAENFSLPRSISPLGAAARFLLTWQQFVISGILFMIIIFYLLYNRTIRPKLGT